MHFHAILAQRRSHSNVRQRERMTKRYPLRRPLASRNPRNPRHFQRIALRIFQPPHCPHHRRLHLHKRPRRRRSRSHRLGRNIHHGHTGILPVMRKPLQVQFPLLGAFSAHSASLRYPYFFDVVSVLHRNQTASRRNKIGTLVPAGTCDNSGATTRKQLALAIAAISPDPCQRSAFTTPTSIFPATSLSALPAPSGHSTRAGKKCVIPDFSFKSSASVACTNGKARAAAPVSKSIAGITKSSNVTIVDKGFPGSPNTGFPWQIANTAGFPGRIATASKKNSACISRKTFSTKS